VTVLRVIHGRRATAVIGHELLAELDSSRNSTYLIYALRLNTALSAGQQLERLRTPFCVPELKLLCYEAAMTITLTPEQLAWINAHVARGDFPSIEDAVRQLIDERIAERLIEDDDLSWAKPLVDEAIAEVERGDFLSLDEYEARDAARLAMMRG
jgi:antitoxin ParD1/3/4